LLLRYLDCGNNGLIGTPAFFTGFAEFTFSRWRCVVADIFLQQALGAAGTITTRIADDVALARLDSIDAFAPWAPLGHNAIPRATRHEAVFQPGSFIGWAETKLMLNTFGISVGDRGIATTHTALGLNTRSLRDASVRTLTIFFRRTNQAVRTIDVAVLRFLEDGARNTLTEGGLSDFTSALFEAITTFRRARAPVRPITDFAILIARRSVARMVLYQLIWAVATTIGRLNQNCAVTRSLLLIFTSRAARRTHSP
jgi:hypothetical protein